MAALAILYSFISKGKSSIEEEEEEEEEIGLVKLKIFLNQKYNNLKNQITFCGQVCCFVLKFWRCKIINMSWIKFLIFSMEILLGFKTLYCKKSQFGISSCIFLV